MQLGGHARVIARRTLGEKENMEKGKETTDYLKIKIRSL